jgi:hypothetical protein
VPQRSWLSAVGVAAGCERGLFLGRGGGRSSKESRGAVRVTCLGFEAVEAGERAEGR